MAIVWINTISSKNATAVNPPQIPMIDAIIKITVFSFK
jgi:hypothetical protein